MADLPGSSGDGDGPTGGRGGARRASGAGGSTWSPAWRLGGAGLTSFGVFALLGLDGAFRNLLSTLLVPGLLVVAFPPPWNDRKKTSIGLVLGIVGALGVPVAFLTVQPAPVDRACAHQPAAGTPIPLKFSEYRTDTSATFTHSGNEWVLTFPNLKWAGLFASVPAGVCRYRVNFEALVTENPDAAEGAGWGYGSGVCNKLGATAPTGSSLQYALAQQKGRPIASLLRVVLPEANTYVRNVTSNLDTYNYSYNRWTIDVDGNTARWTYDDDFLVDESRIYGPDGGLPGDCAGSGLFLRGWGGTVRFRDIEAVAL